jgi:hypothetical protein
VRPPIDVGYDGVQPHNVIDYWDWSQREGAVTYPNLLLFAALEAAAEVEQWLREPEWARLARDLAGALKVRLLDAFWDEDRASLAEAFSEQGRCNHLYTAIQYLAITSGLLDEDRSRRVMATIDDRLSELGATWDTFGVPTNLYDASVNMPTFPPGASDVVRFGHTMNGGRLLFWTYFEVGALVRTGHPERAWQRLVGIFERFRATSLLEGVNYWDYRGRPDLARLEPYLSDVALVTAAIPRWMLGITAQFDGIDLDPALTSGYEGGSITFDYRGQPVRIRVSNWASRPEVDATSEQPISVRILERGRQMSELTIVYNGDLVRLSTSGHVPASSPPPREATR